MNEYFPVTFMEVVYMELGTDSELWWLFLFRGLIAVLFGLLFLFWPGIVLSVFVILLGLFIIMNSLIWLWQSLKTPAGEGRSTLMLLASMLGILVGVVALIAPFFIASIIVWIIAIILIITGFSELGMAIFVEGIGANRILLGIMGALAVILGGIFLFYPLLGAATIIYIVGIFAIVFGIMSIVLAFMIKPKKG